MSAKVAITPMPTPIRNSINERDRYSYVNGHPKIPIDSIIKPSFNVHNLPLVSPKIIDTIDPAMQPTKTEPLSMES